MIKRKLTVRVVAAVMLTVAVVWLADSGSWSWTLLALLAGLAGANLGRSSLDSTTKPLTSSWWEQGETPDTRSGLRGWAVRLRFPRRIRRFSLGRTAGDA